MKRIVTCTGIVSALAAATLIGGCGSGGGGGSSALVPGSPVIPGSSVVPSAAGTSLNGIALAPASQIAELPAGRSFLAALGRSMDLFGTPAEAAVNVPHRAVVNAVVTIRHRSTGVIVPLSSAVTTSSDGHFTIPNPPTGPDLEVEVSDGVVDLKAPIPATGVTQITCDEVSTVAEDAAEEAQAEGQSPEDADATAAEVERDQDQDEQANPADVPDVHHNNADPNRGPHHFAEERLTEHLGEHLTAAQGGNDPHENEHAIQDAVDFARVRFGAGEDLFDSNAARALAQGPASFTDTAIVNALIKAGLTTITAPQVDAAVQALLSSADFKNLGLTLDPSKIPASFLPLLVLQQGAGNPLALSTQAAVNAAVGSLTGTTVAPGSGNDTSGNNNGGANNSGGNSGNGNLAGQGISNAAGHGADG